MIKPSADVVAIGNMYAADVSPIQVLEMTLSDLRCGEIDADCVAVVLHQRSTPDRYSTTWVRMGAATDLEVVGILEFGKSAVKSREGIYTDED